MKKNIRIAAIAVLVSAGCSTNDRAGEHATMTEPGITSFEIRDTADETIVRGLDADGNEAARLDLVHGRFTLTGMFKGDYETPEVDGRKLDVTIRGDLRLTWETAGYDPVLHLPAHPPTETDLAAFLADAHVAPVLARWQIGFDADANRADESPFGGGGTTAGTNEYWCLNNSPNSQCGSARGFTINTCGGSSAPLDAWRVTRTTPSYSYNEYVIDQCCPGGSGGELSDWFATKSCPTTGTGAQPSTCGTTGTMAACKSCPGYPVTASYACNVDPAVSGLAYCYLRDNDADTCFMTYDGEACSSDLPRQNQCSCMCTCNGSQFVCG